MTRRMICQQPWENIMLYPGDSWGPCCDLHIPGKRPRTAADIMALYNSPELMEIRQALLDGTALETTCRGCSIAGAAHYLPDGFPGFYGDKSITVSEPPQRIVAITSSVCNLRCVMCDSHSKPLLRELGKDDLRIVEEIGFDRLDSITIAGGEPFVSTDSIDLLEGLAARDTRNMKIRVISNGQVIDQRLDLIARLRNLHLTISVDGSDETYEHIRQRARWDRLVANLAKLKAVRDSRDDMDLTLNSIVMRSTLPCLADVIDLGTWLEARIDFQIIRTASSAEEEIRGNVSREAAFAALDRAILHARRHGADMGRERMQHICDTLLDIRNAIGAWWSLQSASGDS